MCVTCPASHVAVEEAAGRGAVPHAGRPSKPSAEALAASLARLAADPALAGAMGRAGRERVLARFSMQAMVSAYQGIYDSRAGLAPGRMAVSP